jgi:hypothetical protein
LSHENDVILAEADNRRLLRQKEREIKEKKNTGKRRYRMAASTEQEKRIAYVLTDVLHHCCVPFHLISS